MRRLLVLSLLLMLQLSFATVVVNSFDGRDVVSGIYYAAIQGEEVVFLTPSTNELSAYSRIGTGRDIFLIQSLDYPIFTGMANNLEQRGNSVEVFASDNSIEANLELAGMSDASGYILVDPVYGYNTVSALAYAKLNSMYLVFADKDNAESVAAFLSSENPESVLLYGYMDSEVKNHLGASSVSYNEINNGDKFDDNLELVQRYFAQNPSKDQAILSDGSAIEATIAGGDDPVILISPLIPKVVYDYIEKQALSGSLPVVMLVDDAYTQTAYDLKTEINDGAGSKVLSVFVKMGEGSGSSAAPRPVEMFPLPVPTVGLAIESAQYNQNSKELEVTYENTGNALEYVESNILVFVDGSYIATLGDEEPFPVERERKIGIAYPLDIESGQISVNITSFFGSSKKSQESGIQVMMDAGRVDFVDSSDLLISDFTHDRETNDLHVSFANNGSSTVYFRPYATINKDGTKTTIKDENTYILAANEGHIVKFPGIVKEESSIVAGADYGEREAFMDNKVEQEYVPSSEGPDMLLILVIAVVLIIAAVFAYTQLRK